MDTSLTIQDLFKLILFLLGIGAIAYLISVLRNVNKIVGQIRVILEANDKEINNTIKQLPEISENVNSITKEANKTIKELTPEINGLLHNINVVSRKVENITSTIDNTTNRFGDTVDAVSESIVDTALNFKYNSKNITDYLNLLKEIFEVIKNAIQR